MIKELLKHWLFGKHCWCYQCDYKNGDYRICKFCGERVKVKNGKIDT